MAIKVLVTALGQQLIADTKQIENKETNELVGYWLDNPRVIAYSQNEEGEVSVNFGNYCLVSDEAAFSVRAEHVVAILEPRQDVVEAYASLLAAPEEETTTLEGTDDGSDVTLTEEPASDAGVVDGTVGDGTESAPAVADGGDGQVEAVADTVA